MDQNTNAPALSPHHCLRAPHVISFFSNPIFPTPPPLQWPPRPSPPPPPHPPHPPIAATVRSFTAADNHAAAIRALCSLLADGDSLLLSLPPSPASKSSSCCCGGVGVEGVAPPQTSNYRRALGQLPLPPPRRPRFRRWALERDSMADEAGAAAGGRSRGHGWGSSSSRSVKVPEARAAAVAASSSRGPQGPRRWGSSRGREQQVREGRRGRGSRDIGRGSSRGREGHGGRGSKSRDIAAAIFGCQLIGDDEQRRKG
ncbi:hypothetical protein C2845_PM01G42760 [Panicum miliaceum]|uniref:Uncharacterized protein n=1 Tax=Panicum miliaceum TaxID=4540 RepID=A0A3L6TRN9_PANMI|nr:hypothetical protein C2845_PM01G42760 [Panicum miliaceum]